MKRIISILLLIFILCGCAVKPNENVPKDETTKEIETTSLKLEPLPLVVSTFSRLNAVALTWGEPISNTDSDYREKIDSGVTYCPVRVTYDEIFYSSFQIFNYREVNEGKASEADVLKSLSSGYVYLPRDLISEFPSGKKQLVFLDLASRGSPNAETYRLLYSTKQNQFVEPIFDIVDGRIVFPDYYEDCHFEFFVYYANCALKEENVHAVLFEDGMLLSDFGKYVDRVVSYKK